jgi:hypothetical protein
MRGTKNLVRTRLVGGDGIRVDVFLEKPVAEWIAG